MRRFIQVFALLLATLAGSLAGVRPQAQALPCCAGMPCCPCPPLSRSHGPEAPSGLVTAAPVAVLASPCREARPRIEPAPYPQAWLGGRARIMEAGLRARPGSGPSPGPSLDRQAQLSVFRI